ncbi:MAG TPA: hypothetical protein VGY53_05325 [Isosphaeraceae bacterium]|nr:hypothetical protein [Isosphaeraceae bacterium]
MANPEGQGPSDAELVFAAHNTHHKSCGIPPRLRNTDNPELYYGYYENCHGEQFVFTFDQATLSGTISGGDIDWGHSKSFTLELVEEALRSTQSLAAQFEARAPDQVSRLPFIDAAFALGRLTGLTGKEEVIWLRACLSACTLLRWSGVGPGA